jgi:[ribosomal protein S18]-alanine N-acetyltransferase
MPNSTLRLSPDNVQLRPATLRDIPHMRELEQSTKTAARWRAAQYDELFAPGAPARITIVAIEESAEAPIHGFLIARCLPDEWEIENVIVDKQYRQRGIGSLLVRELLARARVGGACSVILEVRESNLPALRLYETIGFKPEGRRRDYYQDPVEDAILYRITLADL